MYNEKIIRYTDFLLMDDRSIKYVLKNGEHDNLVYFKVKLVNNDEYIFGPVSKRVGSYEQIMDKVTRINNRRKTNSNCRTIRTSSGTIKEYSSKPKTKTSRFGFKGAIAIGLAAVIGFSASSILSKSDINIKDSIGNSLNAIADKLDEARLAGTMTDERLREEYARILSEDPYNKGARNFFNYMEEKGRSK